MYFNMLCKPASTKVANKHCRLMVRQAADKDRFCLLCRSCVVEALMMFGASVLSLHCQTLDPNVCSLELAKRLAERAFGFRWIEVGIR